MRDAEQQRARVVTPFTLARNVDRLKLVSAPLADARQEQQWAARGGSPPLQPAWAWDAYPPSQALPGSGGATVGHCERHPRKLGAWVSAQPTQAQRIRDVTAETRFWAWSRLGGSQVAFLAPCGFIPQEREFGSERGRRACLSPAELPLLPHKAAGGSRSVTRI